MKKLFKIDMKEIKKDKWINERKKKAGNMKK